MTYGDMMKPDGLRQIAGYAHVIGPSTKNVGLRIDVSGVHSTLVDAAHQAGLKVAVYTFRPENYFHDPAFKGDGAAQARDEDGSVREMRSFISAGIDALFTDDPALGRRAVDGP
jgi:glycerophosphoryl diester phosphodiesterase